MNLSWLTIVDAIMLVTLFLGAPLISALIGYRAYKGWPRTFNRQSFFLLFLLTIIAAMALLAGAQRMKADVRTPLFLLQVLCFEAGAVLFGVAGGWFLGIFLHRLGSPQPEKGYPEHHRFHRHDSRLRPRYWAMIIFVVNLVDVLLLAQSMPYGREGPDMFQGVILLLQFIALGGCYWMLAHWFIKKGQRQFKAWMWLFFVPWGWLWYCFEVLPFLRPTDEETA
jgi:hypothetical protein